MTTPAMRQYKELKLRYPDTILFFRMGDFYEMFYEDARTASKVLGLALTSRSKGDDAVPLAGVPYHAIDSYLAKMIRAGFRVAICEQMEDPKKATGLVARDVVRVVTPGTLTDETLLDDRRSNYLAAVLPPVDAAKSGDQAGLAWVELSTGKFFCEDASFAAICDELARLGVAECLLSEDFLSGVESPDLRRLRSAAGSPLVKRPPYVFDADDATRRLTAHFALATLDGFGLADVPRGTRAAGAILQYLEETQKTALGHIRRLGAVRRGRYLYLDEATVRSLELSRTIRGESREHTLLGVLDRTRSPMGARLVRSWLQFPLADVERINARLEAVDELVSARETRDELSARLDDLADLERIVGRVAVNRAGPRDLLSLSRSLAQLPAIKARLAGCKSARLATLERRIELLPDLRDLLEKSIAEDAPALLREGGVIRAGWDAELDRLRDIRSGGARWLAEYQVREVARTGIKTLRVGFNAVFGYYLEITNAHAEKVPVEYTRKQTLKNAERYITPELKEHETEVLGAEEKSLAREDELFQQIRARVAEFTAALQSVSDALAETDVLTTFADLAVRLRWTRPQVDDSLVLELHDARHPVLDAVLGSDFVPNDTLLSPDACRLMIITGPNMAGKSTYIRQTALLVLLAQMGCFVPARAAKIGVVDRIFTRVGAADELARGQSTFMVEMTETANILNNATDRSLVILDEVGRGTSTFDGLALAWAITEHLARDLQCRTLFATHYHELTELSGLLPATANFNVAVREWQDEIVFLHKIVPGGTDKSYGIHVARLAGVPRPVVERALSILSSLEAQHVDEDGRSLLAQRANAAASSSSSSALTPSPGAGGMAADVCRHESQTLGKESSLLHPAPSAQSAKSPPRRDQLSLFEDSGRVVLAMLRKLNLDQMTPLEALMKLKELKDKT
jgi:DNA mismatch repair protein MutS